MISKSDLCSDHILMEIRNDVRCGQQHNEFIPITKIDSEIENRNFIHEILIFYSYSMGIIYMYVSMVLFVCFWPHILLHTAHSSSANASTIHQIHTIGRKIIQKKSTSDWECERTKEGKTDLICVRHRIAKSSDEDPNKINSCVSMTLNQWILIISFFFVRTHVACIPYNCRTRIQNS